MFGSNKKSKRKPFISEPTNFEHRVHTGYDDDHGTFVGLPQQWSGVVNSSPSPTGYRPQPIIDPSAITHTEVEPLKTIVRGNNSLNRDRGYPGDMNNLSVARSNSLRQYNMAHGNGQGRYDGMQHSPISEQHDPRYPPRNQHGQGTPYNEFQQYSQGGPAHDPRMGRDDRNHTHYPDYGDHQGDHYRGQPDDRMHPNQRMRPDQPRGMHPDQQRMPQSHHPEMNGQYPGPPQDPRNYREYRLLIFFHSFFVNLNYNQMLLCT